MGRPPVLADGPGNGGRAVSAGRGWKKRTSRWFIKFPLDAYALGPVDVRGNSERAARRWAREWSGVDRLPEGFSCWRAGQREVEP